MPGSIAAMGRSNAAWPADLRLPLHGIRNEEIRLLGSGWNADAWLVPAADGEWVARLPKNEWARGETERQACLAPKLAAHGIPVPRDWSVVHDEQGNLVAGLYRYVEGEPAPGRGHALRSLVPVVAELLEAVHSVPTEEAFSCGAEHTDPWEGRWWPIIERHGKSLPPKSRAWVREAGGRLEMLCRSRRAPVLIHGDLQPGHLLLNERRDIVAVLDFSGPTVSDAAIDFGRLIQFWNHSFAERVLAAYTLPIDPGFRERARLYAALEPLRTIAFEAELGQDEWTAWARRKLAASARTAETADEATRDNS